MGKIARKAEEVGLDVFATGEHHNPPFVPSSPTTLLGYVAGQTARFLLSTSTTLITTNDPVKIAEDFEFAARRAPGVPDAPTHESLQAGADAETARQLVSP